MSKGESIKKGGGGKTNELLCSLVSHQTSRLGLSLLDKQSGKVTEAALY